MMQCNFEKINAALSDLSKLRRSEAVERKTPDGYNYENGYEIYKVDEDVYIKLEIYEDSYGNNSEVVGVQFVTPKKVQIMNFEPLI